MLDQTRFEIHVSTLLRFIKVPVNHMHCICALLFMLIYRTVKCELSYQSTRIYILIDYNLIECEFGLKVL